ncbi:MAG: LacI family transcriptional regulator [Chloroflexi bacterium]|nr:LacI family transcriptional regulator [Chloroflexota bacterium]MCL5274129.1 LacI family transcriptional regulator [Chloroflexota bacterium]
MPTLSDIASDVGVSIMTVSRALADKPGVAQETRQRVLESAKRLGYATNPEGRAAVRETTSTIGVLVNNIGSEYAGEIIDGISNILDVANYDIVIFNPFRMRRAPSDYVIEVCRYAIDGLLIAAANRLQQQSVDYLEQMIRQHFPVVFIDQRVADSTIPCITAQNWQGAYDATRYLIQLGHRRIGFVLGPHTESPSGERLAGYRDALTQNGIVYDDCLIRNGDFARHSGYIAAQSLMALDEPPTAIFASNDPMAFGVYKAVQQAGKRIPEDISVIGFDDIGLSADIHPALTTVRQPLREMGRVGAQMLLDMLRDNPHMKSAELRTSLILRDSCAPSR